MDTTAHRSITAARDALINTFGLGCHRPEKHGIDAQQRATIDAAAFALNSLLMEDPAPPECETCATPLTQPATGRPRRFCSTACRSADYRARGGALASDENHAWAGLSQHARLLIMGAGVTVQAYTEHHFPDGVWRGDECGCTDDRCIGHHHLDHENCGCLPVCLEEVLDRQGTPPA